MVDFEPDRVDIVVEQYLRYLEDRHTPPTLTHLTRAERAEVEAILRILDASWKSEVCSLPTLERDQLPIQLGLVSAPGRMIQLSVQPSKTARNRSSPELTIT